MDIHGTKESDLVKERETRNHWMGIVQLIEFTFYNGHNNVIYSGWYFYVRSDLREELFK
jgi:hypothetical protein